MKTKSKVYIRENSLVAGWAARKLGCSQVAIVLGKTIHLHNTTTDQFLARPSWVCHELKHVEQYARWGTLIFLARYFAEYIKHGYWNNALEVEARSAEDDLSLLNRFELPHH